MEKHRAADAEGRVNVTVEKSNGNANYNYNEHYNDKINDNQDLSCTVKLLTIRMTTRLFKHGI